MPTATAIPISSAAEGNIVGISSHPCYTNVSEISSVYPRQAGPLFHSYVDLTQVARWSQVKSIDLRDGLNHKADDRVPSGGGGAGSGWGALLGRRPDGKHLECVVPCYVSDNMCTAFFDAIFASLDAHQQKQEKTTTMTLDTGHILLAILSPDSTVVYYKLARGLIKPVN